jgi:hypothetical protein
MHLVGSPPRNSDTANGSVRGSLVVIDFLKSNATRGFFSTELPFLLPNTAWNSNCVMPIKQLLL